MNQDQNSPWEYKPNGTTSVDTNNSSLGSSAPANHIKRPAEISWQAAEFIEHPHPSSWYMTLAVGTVLLAGLVYLMSKDFFATGTILVVGVIVAVFAGHKPSKVQYQISDAGLSVNGKNYPYGSFKSFAVLQEGPLSSVNFFPLKRFMPPVSAYFDPKDGEKIIDSLGDYLPYEERKMDAVDRLSRRLRL